MSDEFFHRVVQESADAIIVADAGGVVRFWNSGAEEMFGHAAADAVGRRMDMIIPESLRARHWEGYDRVMAGAASRYGRHDLLKVPALRADGSRVSVEFTLQFLDHPDLGRVAVATIRDVTEGFNELRDLRRQLAEARSGAQGAEM